MIERANTKMGCEKKVVKRGGREGGGMGFSESGTVEKNPILLSPKEIKKELAG